jgi:hypothetical protein
MRFKQAPSPYPDGAGKTASSLSCCPHLCLLPVQWSHTDYLGLCALRSVRHLFVLCFLLHSDDNLQVAWFLVVCSHSLKCYQLVLLYILSVRFWFIYLVILSLLMYVFGRIQKFGCHCNLYLPKYQ